MEGAPAQLIGANFKKKIRPRPIIKVTSLQCRINLAAKVAYDTGPARFQGPRAPYGGLSFLFLAEDLFVVDLLPMQGRMQDLPNGGGGRTPSPKVGLCGGGGANSGGGGRQSKHWPPGAGDPRYATGQLISHTT